MYIISYYKIMLCLSLYSYNWLCEAQGRMCFMRKSSSKYYRLYYGPRGGCQFAAAHSLSVPRSR